MKSDMLELVEDLERLLKVGGALAFTFIDPHYHSWPGRYAGTNLQWRLDRFGEADVELDVPGLLEKARNADWCMLVDGTTCTSKMRI